MSVARPTSTLSRRSLLATTLTGSLAGGIWGTGFSQLVQGSGPRLSVVGEDSWQVAVLTSGRHRLLLCIGTYKESPAGAIDRILGTLRPRIDIVVMSPSAASTLGGAFVRRRNVSMSFVLEDSASHQGQAMSIPQRISGAGFTMDIATIAAGTTEAETAWLANLVMDGSMVSFGPTLEVILEQAPATTGVAIAPAGDVGAFHSRWRSCTVVVNAGSARDLSAVPPTTKAINSGVAGLLVRTFPEDIARFDARQSGITLPDWAQQLD